jgi:hypothetical protein
VRNVLGGGDLSRVCVCVSCTAPRRRRENVGPCLTHDLDRHRKFIKTITTTTRSSDEMVASWGCRKRNVNQKTNIRRLCPRDGPCPLQGELPPAATLDVQLTSPMSCYVAMRLLRPPRALFAVFRSLSQLNEVTRSKRRAQSTSAIETAIPLRQRVSCNCSSPIARFHRRRS